MTQPRAENLSVAFLSKTYQLFNNIQSFHPKDCPSLKKVEDQLGLFTAKQQSPEETTQHLLQILQDFKAKKPTLLTPIAYSEKKFFSDLQIIAQDLNVVNATLGTK